MKKLTKSKAQVIITIKNKKMQREREREYSMKQMISSVRREKGGSGGAEDEVGEESEEMGEIIGL